ncbi:bifunctional helix-turn-helix transcriptional regulator/GNAT family N-acetyltransferase [Caenimonas aquaedulcis]|uniref:Bifunctional helix-turn-helix transcriptional regulator/GNAT family N-acetyltransferase n=1 Tax=Caenimonas aquaedulcis TaxID=2793270 RepID=A0A931H1J1_9BURK|nr:bifunctional helix-turn-helix transcriptional regulator/GNAT family N-acetyltransferase [Caenimonas aquaedulcis]MBG9386843.1 bifunctional helix-turn-helix transcriptional regulator/GNAT family N-acetyltransferase [Caenimonas aquaedulcis]
MKASASSPSTASPVSPAHVKAVRGFNRFYTQRIGVLDPYLGSEFSLTEVRVLYELAHRDQPTATELARDLTLDAGYLSRILRRFESRGWLARSPSPADARTSLLRLTAAGHKVFAPLQQKSRDEAAALLAALPETRRTELIAAMGTVQRLLDGAASAPGSRTIVLRDPQPGDMGWVIEQHGALYAREWGYTADFEALVADIAAQFIRKFDPAWEKAWIAEIDGERVGSVFVVRKSATVAKLRLLILTPQARGLGLGGRLTDECIAFARAKGYRKLVLWTQSELLAARAIYKSRGFVRTASERNNAFGKRLTSETWELDLR